MIHFIIAGKPDCKKFVQAANVAYYLQHNLPAFEFTKLEFPGDEWDEYLVRTNREHKWHHGSSPLIYQELWSYGTKKPNLIGGLGEFWEYCYDYYGLECVMRKDEIEALKNENAKLFEQKSKQNNSNEMLKIMIYGATNMMTTLLLPEFMKIEGCGDISGLQFLLYDEKLETYNPQFFEDFNEEFKDMFGSKAIYCDNLSVGIRDCNLLIIIDDTSELETNGNDQAMQNYLMQIFFLAEEINLSGKRNLRIVFANSGLSCLVATILARKIRISHSQVVVVSSDLGLGYLGEMSRCLSIDTRKMCAPPVWGSLGLNEFVDAGSTLIKCKVYKPYARAVRATADSTLTHGTIHCELRFINYLSDDIKDLKETVKNRREIVKNKLQRAPLLAKLEALLNLIKIWYNCSNLKDPIISLGIMSDGSFNIPPGIIFSQPAIQFRGGWIPYTNYPVPEHTLETVMAAGAEAANHYSKYSTGVIFQQAKTEMASRYKATSSDHNSEPMIRDNASNESKIILSRNLSTVKISKY